MAPEARPSFSLVLGVVSLAATSFAACTGDEPGGIKKVTEDGLLQAKFETARRALVEIKENKKFGRDIYSDCRTIQMVLLKDLKKIEADPAKKLVKELAEVCTDVPASP
jgi:hypothetical protein